MRVEHLRDQNKQPGVVFGWGKVGQAAAGWERRKGKRGQQLPRVSSCLEAVAAVGKYKGNPVVVGHGFVAED